jgi:hypothetical protein
LDFSVRRSRASAAVEGRSAISGLKSCITQSAQGPRAVRSAFRQVSNVVLKMPNSDLFFAIRAKGFSLRN